jgi:hypothetical protein
MNVGFVAVGAFVLLFGGLTAMADHPFIAVSSGEYSTLRALAAYPPWDGMASNAFSAATNTTVTATDSITDRSKDLSILMSANALAYILETNTVTRRAYKDTIIDNFTWWDPNTTGNLYSELSTSTWDYTVPPGCAFMNTLLAFDIIYPALNSADRTSTENLLANVVAWYNGHMSSWKQSDYAVRGLWAIYQGDTAALAAATSGYRNFLLSRMTDSGGYNEGVGYAVARNLNADREQKHFFIDILEYNGDNSWYSDPQMQNFYEWIAGYTHTPSKQRWTFGDTKIGGFHATYCGQVRSPLFGKTAGAYAARLQDGFTLPGDLMTYLVLSEQSTTPVAPVSRIFPDTGVWLQEPSLDTNVLAGVLWNCTAAQTHSRKEVNAINLAGYGQLLLSGAGYGSWGVGQWGYSWDYFHSRAVSGNAALIDYSIGIATNPSAVNDHASCVGDGVKGILSSRSDPNVDLVTGYSGLALTNGMHLRTLAFVHPQDGQNGYFVTFDEMTPDTSGDSAHLAWHPLSRDTVAGNLTTVTASQQYLATITDASGADTGVRLTTFMATPPSGVTVQDGAFCTFGTAKYLFASYTTSGSRTLLTVHYPSDATHAIPAFTRDNGTGYSGVKIGNYDYAIGCDDAASTNSSAYTVAGVTANAKAAIFRKSNSAADSQAFWYAAKGFSLKDSAATPRGFSSDQEIMIQVNNRRGKVLADAQSVVTFYEPSCSGALLDGQLLDSVAVTDGFTCVIPAGEHDLTFISPDVIPTEADTYVVGGTYANNSYGSSASMQVKEDTNDSYDRRSFMRFDLSGMTSSAVRATLRLVPTSVGSDTNLTVQILLVPDNSWSESTLTWNTQPSTSTVLATLGNINLSQPVTLDWDLAQAVNAARLADQKLSLALIVSSSPSGARFAAFATKEYTSNTAFRPALLILGEDAFVGSYASTSEADTYVVGGTNADNSYGGNTTMLVKEDTNDSYDRRSFVRFDLSAYEKEPVLRATMRLMPTAIGTSTGFTASVLLVPDNLWDESTLTWNTKPSGTDELGTFTDPAVYAPVDLDLTSAINEALLGDQKISVTVEAINEPSGSRYANFATKEYTSNTAYRPTLFVLRSDLLVLPEIIVDNADGTGVTFIGTWGTSAFRPGYYSTDYRHDNNSEKGSKSVRFTPNIAVVGTYKVYARWVSYSGYSSGVPMDIVHSGGTDTVTVDQTQNGGTWNLLGSYTFDVGTVGSVLIRNDGTIGHVIADAVKFVKQ